jgi:hypothetical protein
VVPFAAWWAIGWAVVVVEGMIGSCFLYEI